MTEELEKKLNELLGLKKLLEEATEEKQKTATSSAVNKYKKESKFNLIRCCIVIVLGWGMVVFGVIVYQLTHDVVYIDCPTIIIAGLLLMIVAKICWLIRQSKLTVLQEMKQFELRITEMLKK
jgi:uncharacterized transporter YbjL